MEKQQELELEVDLEPLDSEKDNDVIIVDEPEVSKKDELSAEDGIADLKAKLEAEKTARIDAENRLRTASQEAFQAKTDVADTNIRLIDNAIETVKRNSEILKQNLRDAMAAGDYDSAADIQTNMDQARFDLRELQNGKQRYEYEAQKQAQEPIRHADPVESLASSLTPRSADWVRAHPEYARNPTLYDKMVKAHGIAIADGLKPDTDDYFSHVEQTLRIAPISRDEPQESALSEAAAPTQRRSAPPAAPVSRSGGTSGTRPGVVSLSRAEREAARDMGMSDREYANNKLALVREGKL